jgi:hypothetical protein
MWRASHAGLKEGRMNESKERVSFAADFSGGRRAEVELRDNALWVAADSGIEIADVWMNGIDGEVDLRVRIMRLGSALEVSIDRGEQSKNWWAGNAVPRLLIVLDRTHGTALATASVGVADQARNFELGNVEY